MGDRRTGAAAPVDRSILRRYVGSIVVVAFLALFVAANRSELPAAWRQIRTADVGWLAAAAGFSCGGLMAIALLHLAAQRAVGLRLTLGKALPLALVSHLLNIVTKSGGMAGASVFVADARRRGRPPGPTVAAYVLAAMLTDTGFALTLVVAIGLVIIDGQLSRPEVIACAVFAVLFGFRVFAVTAAIRSRSALRRLYAAPRALANRLLRRAQPSPPDTTAADELYDAVQLIRRRPRSILLPVVCAAAVEGAGIGILWAVLRAVHSSLGSSVSVIAYAVSVLFAIVGFLPAGLGFVEVSLGAVLVSFGSTFAQATAMVALYRLIELWLPLLLGAIAAQHVRRGRRSP